MSRADQAQWDAKWRRDPRGREVNALLVTHAGLLRGGVALDVACGVGQNAVWLATQDYDVLGVDVSAVALRRARELARKAGVQRRVLLAHVDLDDWRPPPHSVDLICVLRFLDRALVPALRAALRPGGLVFYATRHVGLLERQPDATRAYLLERGELADLFGRWELITHREGAENAALVARKPV